MEEQAEELLRRVMTGELARDDAEVVRAAEASPEFRAALDGMLDVVSILDGDAEVERETLTGAAQMTGAPGQELVQSTLDQLLDEGRPATFPWKPLLAVAAALVALLAVVSQLGGPEPDRPDGQMMGAGIRDLWPTGIVGAVPEFRWQGDLPAGAVFELRIWHADDYPDGSPWKEVELTDTAWTPSEEALDEMPRRGHWSVKSARSGSVHDVAVHADYSRSD